MTEWCDFQARTRLIHGPGSLERLGDLAREYGFRRTLVVSDPGVVAAGHWDKAVEALRAVGVVIGGFHEFGENPDAAMAERGRLWAVELAPDSIVGIGGGSSLDCAKAINFLLTNGGRMQDYRGYGKASRPMLPMIGIPTTAGTGSEAQSYALISDEATHVKMACGDPKAAFRAVILDPLLAISAPARVRAAAGYDAISHAVETFVTTRRNPVSECFSREAWRLLDGNFERVLRDQDDTEVMGAMQLGAFYAGLAIENSMLGATHACANPLTGRYGMTHGVAIALLLAHVVRWNMSVVNGRYAELDPDLPARLERLRSIAGFPERLRDAGASAADLPRLAEDAATQWTGEFNPRPLDASGALEIYRCAY